ncbi:MAG: MBL fold metallo-hydrolase [Gammaproteobacteria bacterium]
METKEVPVQTKTGRDFSYAVLGSGSKGNATLVKAENTLIMIDCGLPIDLLVERLDAKNIDPKSITAILISHEHGDHIHGLGDFNRIHDCPIYMTKGTYYAQKQVKKNWSKVIYEETVSIGGIEVFPFRVSHDSRMPSHFTFTFDGRKFGHLTDTGSYSQDMINSLTDCDALAIEFNYDDQMLRKGIYPDWLKKRVASDVGHLSNNQAFELVSRINSPKLQWLVMLHISLKNNSTDCIENSLKKFSSLDKIKIYYADQFIPSPWFDI